MARRAWRAAGALPGREPYLWIRASRLAPPWVPHTGVAYRRDDGVLVVRSFGPIDERPLKIWHVWRVLVFRGRWRDGD